MRESSRISREADVAVTPSSGNVFVDIGFDPVEAFHLELRSNLMFAIADIMRSRRLSQSDAAKLFRVTQPRVSNLVRGRLDLFSLDMLVTMLARAGVLVRIDVTEPTVAAPYAVYILRCADGSLYTGVTNDLDVRVRKHNDGRGAKYTAGRGPVRVVYSEVCESRSAAQKREAQIKRLPRAKKETLIAGV